MKRGEEPATATSFRSPAPFQAEAQGHSLAFYPDGADRRDALLDLIASARETLEVAFYIFAPDGSGRLVRDALVEAARRGVKVTIIVDGFGAAADKAFFEPLIAAGGLFRCFIAAWSFRFLIRNHQKMVIADRTRAMLGGFNVEDDYFAPPQENGWNDLAFTVEGPVVEKIVVWFSQLDDWAARPDAQFADIRRKLRHWDSGEAPVQLLIGGPTRGLSSWAHCVSRDLVQGERLDMMMAYFSPSRRLLRRICRIAKRGQARLVLAGKSDNGATIGASRSLYAKLLGSGARIWEFDASKLHAKLIVLDDAVYIGSANFDMRSLYINLEIVLRIEDKQLADTMRAFVTQHLAASVAITPELHRRRASLWNRVRWGTSWFLVSVLDYTVSRKLNLGL
jgi:cardiolipin synthase